MKKLLFAPILFIFLMAACSPQQTKDQKATPESESLPTKSQMTEQEAKVIAEASCIKGGEALGAGTYNENSKTWGFEANLNATQSGCSPTCVVSEEDKTAQINWQCTGEVQAKEGESNESDKRVLLTAENVSQYTADPEQTGLCDSVNFNNDPANTSINYNNQDMGLAFSIPYNPTWGSDKFKINPYNELYKENSLPTQNLDTPKANTLEAIEFGPIQNKGSCMWSRPYKISFVPKNTIDEVVKMAEISSANTSSNDMEPEVIKLGNLTAVKYFMGTVCNNLIIEVLGEKYNYRFSVECGTDIEKDFLNNILKTIKFI